jgi:large subunit ribosomal protein L10
MALRMQRMRKDFLISRVRRQVEQSALVAVVNVGNIGTSQCEQVRRTLAAVGGQVLFTKNSLAAKGLEAAGAADLVPLLKGPTAIATGPAEVPLAKELLTLSTLFPDFFVIGALLNKRRVLEFMEVERLSKLPASDVIHSQLVAQMLPGSSLQVPNVAAYLIGVLHMHVEAQQAASGGGAEAVSK